MSSGRAGRGGAAFGLGTVVAVRGEAEKAQAQIDFGADIGPKWLLLRYAPVAKL